MTPLSTTLAHGLLGRCPECGTGRMFHGFLEVVPRCGHCGTDLTSQDSGDGPVALIILVVGFLVVGSALVVEVKHAWPIWLHLAVWLPLATVLTLGLMRPAKGILIALQYRYRRHEFDAGH